MRTLIVVVAALFALVGAASPAVAQPWSGYSTPPVPVPLPTCTQTGSSALPGGYLVQLYCTGGHSVSGFGSTMADAVLNGRHFGYLAGKGMTCRTTSASIDALPGGYIPTFTCGTKRISGAGSTATDAGRNAYAFADLGHVQIACILPEASVRAMPGGYIATFSCGSRQASGLGDTFTATGINALGFARLLSVFSTSCTMTPTNIALYPGGLIATFTCGSRQVSGVGTTLGDAGRNALGFADVYLYGFDNCTLTPNSIAAMPGGYITTFSCGGRQVSGVGSTLADAGINALGFAGYARHVSRYCTTTLNAITVKPGSYTVRFSCGTRTTTGSGPTLTDAGRHALAEAPL